MQQLGNQERATPPRTPYAIVFFFFYTLNRITILKDTACIEEHLKSATVTRKHITKQLTVEINQVKIWVVFLYYYYFAIRQLKVVQI